MHSHSKHTHVLTHARARTHTQFYDALVRCAVAKFVKTDRVRDLQGALEALLVNHVQVGATHMDHQF